MDFEFDDSGVLVIVRIPVVRGTTYDTIPLGIIITEDVVITVCLEDNPVITELVSGKVRGFYTFKRTRFLLHILFDGQGTIRQYLTDRRNLDYWHRRPCSLPSDSGTYTTSLAIYGPEAIRSL